MAANYDPSMVTAVIPEIGLVVLIFIELALVLFWMHKPNHLRKLGWLTAGGLLVLVGLSFAFARPGEEPVLLFGGMLRQDWLAFVFRAVVLTGAAVTALFAMDSEGLGNRGEFYLLLLSSTLGMSLMAASADLIMLYLAIETTSIPLYVLSGFLIRDNKSSEAGFKYFLFGAMTSAVMLYGFSLLFGFSGTTQIYRLAEMLQAGAISPLAMMGVGLLVLVGFGFKIAAVPLHFWAPDVYEGAPTVVTGFLSTASKAAGFAVLMRVVIAVFPAITPLWTIVLSAMSVASMIMGNTLALTQKNIKRLLAYSSIAHAGYILIGVATLSPLGVAGAVYYLIAYLVTNLAAFGVVTVVSRSVGSDEISSYAGLSRRSPGMALALLVALLSLGGIPPFAGFFAKVLVFGAAVQANLVWLAVVGVINAIVGLYYYLTVLKVVYLYRSEDESKPLVITPAWKLALWVCVVGILVVGVLIAPGFGWATAVAGSIF